MKKTAILVALMVLLAFGAGPGIAAADRSNSCQGLGTAVFSPGADDRADTANDNLRGKFIDRCLPVIENR